MTKSHKHKKQKLTHTHPFHKYFIIIINAAQVAEYRVVSMHHFVELSPDSIWNLASYSIIYCMPPKNNAARGGIVSEYSNM